VHILSILSLSIGRQSVSVLATVMAASEPSVSAVVSVTATTGIQLRRHFRLRLKTEKLVSVGLLVILTEMQNSNNSEDPPSYEEAVTMTPTESLILDMLTRIIDILELIVEHLND